MIIIIIRIKELSIDRTVFAGHVYEINMMPRKRISHIQQH